MKNGKVSFFFRDYKNDNKKSVMTLSAVEFIRRFLLHILPSGFTRIRHYGLYAGQNVETKLAAARRLIAPQPKVESTPKPALNWHERFLENTGIDLMCCPSCGGRLFRERRIESSFVPFQAIGTCNTS